MTAPRSLAPAAVDPKTGRVAVVRVGRVEIQSADDATEPTFVELGGVDAISWTVSGKLFAVTLAGGVAVVAGPVEAVLLVVEVADPRLLHTSPSLGERPARQREPMRVEQEPA